MLNDRYGNNLGTNEQSARDTYIDGVDRFLAAAHGAEAAFRRAVDADNNFALGHIGVARCRLLMNDRSGAATAVSAARLASENSSAREKGHVGAIGQLVDGDAPAAYKSIRAHVSDYPRDVMIAQTCASVFGLIGFSGQAGREAEQLAYTSMLAPAYGEDWWFLGMHAFAQGEIGQLNAARETIERALEGNPGSAHNAHVNAHIYYEAGENEAGSKFLQEWWPNHNKGSVLHCHVSWHVALWLLSDGRYEEAWRIVDQNCTPGNSEGPPLNIMTDTVAFLHRAGLTGHDVPLTQWRNISDYAATFFPKSGLAFADVHAGLAHCMAGNGDAFNHLKDCVAGPARDIVAPIWTAFQALADRDWIRAEENLGAVMSSHERIGGSRAQRDLLEFTLAHVMRRQGRTAEAERLIIMRRPRQAGIAAGLA